MSKSSGGIIFPAAAFPTLENRVCRFQSQSQGHIELSCLPNLAEVTWSSLCALGLYLVSVAYGNREFTSTFATMLKCLLSTPFPRMVGSPWHNVQSCLPCLLLRQCRIPGFFRHPHLLLTPSLDSFRNGAATVEDPIALTHDARHPLSLSHMPQLTYLRKKRREM